MHPGPARRPVPARPEPQRTSPGRGAGASVRPLREGEKPMERRRRRAIVAVRLPLVLTPLRPFHTPARPVHGSQVRQRREPPGLDRSQDQHQDPDEILRADGPLPMRPVTDVIVGRSMVRHPQQSDQMAPAFDTEPRPITMRLGRTAFNRFPQMRSDASQTTIRASRTASS